MATKKPKAKKPAQENKGPKPAGKPKGKKK